MRSERIASESNAQHPDARWVQLADDVLVIAREIQFRGYQSKDALSLTPSEGMVMRHMQLEPDATFASLVAAVGLQRTNLSTVLRGLEHKGLIERRFQPADRRAITIHRTERGRTNFEVASGEWATALEAAAPDGADSLDATLGLLESIRNGLVHARQAAGAGSAHTDKDRRPTGPGRLE